jgi:hypothetical protein
MLIAFQFFRISVFSFTLPTLNHRLSTFFWSVSRSTSVVSYLTAKFDTPRREFFSMGSDFLRACLPTELETLRFARLHKHHARIFAENLTQILLRR